MLLDILIWGVAAYALITIIYLIFGRKKDERSNTERKRHPQASSASNNADIKKYFEKKREQQGSSLAGFEISTSTRVVDDDDPADFEFEIEYMGRDGNVTARKIRDVFESPDGADTMLEAYCSLRCDKRTFRSSRILRCTNLQTGRNIKDLGTYLRKGYGWR